MKTHQRPKSVEAYIAAAPKELRGELKELRTAIKRLPRRPRNASVTGCLITVIRDEWPILRLSKNTLDFIYPLRS